MDYLEILDLVSRKDKRCLEILYTTYGRKLYSFAVEKWCLSEDDAWTVVYQTLDTLILKLSEYKFESKNHFENFIFKVFTNFLRQFYRSTRRQQSDIHFVSMDQYNLASDENTTGDPSVLEIEKKDFEEYYKSGKIENPLLIELQKGLKKLDDIERSLLLLRAQNFSYEEIAELLRIDNNQLKVRHHRAIKKLLKLLSSEKK
jgi:RNA polymerase sigma factor (sigma-70 family)